MWRGLLLILCLLQSGCLSMVSTGASVVYNRHSLENQVVNHVIDTQVENAIATDPQLLRSPHHIKVSIFHQRVLLTGEVPNQHLRQRAAALTARVQGVKHVINRLEVAPPIPTSQRMQDTWITTKIHAKFIADSRMDPNMISITTENGVVYYLGRVTREQANLAVSAAMDTDGVKKVVRAFEYVTYSTEY